MANLNGHETRNGGYSQENTYDNSTFLDPTEAPGKDFSCTEIALIVDRFFRALW